MSKQRTIIALIFIFIIAVFARILSFSGYDGSDGSEYFKFAYKISQGNFNLAQDYIGPPVFPLRVGIFAPIAIALKIFSPSETVAIGYPFFISILSIFLAFLLGKAFFSLRAGLIAAFIQAIISIDMRCASILMPDLIGAFWANLGVLFVYCGSKKDSLILKSVYGILTGITLGLAWFCKETVVYMLPLIIFYILWLSFYQKRNVIILVSICLALLIILAAESIFYYQYVHDFFYRYHMIEKDYLLDKPGYGAAWVWEKGKYGLVKMLRVIFLDNPKAIFINSEFSFVTLSALIAVVYAFFRKMRIFVLPGIWFIFLCLIFNFGSASLKAYRPLSLYQFRYMYPLLLPAILLTAGLCDLLIPLRKPLKQELEKERLFWVSLLIAGIVLASFYGIGKHIWQGKYSKVEREVSLMLSPKGLLIYTDLRSASVLKLFWHYSDQVEIREFSGMGTNDIPAGAYVLVNQDWVEWIHLKHGYVLPQFYKNAPDRWLLKWDKIRAQLYKVP